MKFLSKFKNKNYTYQDFYIFFLKSQNTFQWHLMLHPGSPVKIKEIILLKQQRKRFKYLFSVINLSMNSPCDFQARRFRFNAAIMQNDLSS